MVSDFNGIPLKIDEEEDEDNDQDQDLEDEDDEDMDEGEEDEDEAEGKAWETAANVISIHILKDLMILCWLNSVGYC